MNPMNLLPRMNPANLLKSRAWLELSASWRRKGGDRLELWLPRNWPAEDSELRWRRVAAGGAVQQGAQRGLEGLAPAEEVIVWTPAAETLFLRARLPTRSAAKIVQALPFALEEQLIDPPERLHFAFAHEAVAEGRTEAGAPERIRLAAAPADLDSAAWRDALGLPLEAMRPADASVQPAPLDLLQQHYAPRARLAALKRAYIPAAALFAGWLFATLALDAIEWVRLSRAANAAEEEMRALLVKSFPETRAILDPAEQMRRGLEDLGAGSGIAAPGDMLFLLARAAPVIERESRVRAQGIEYAARVASVRAAPRGTLPANPAGAVGQAAERQGLRDRLKRTDAEGANAVRVQIEDAPFAALMAWLAELQQQSGLRAESATLDRGANPGTVNGRLLLRAQGS